MMWIWIHGWIVFVLGSGAVSVGVVAEKAPPRIRLLLVGVGATVAAFSLGAAMGVDAVATSNAALFAGRVGGLMGGLFPW